MNEQTVLANGPTYQPKMKLMPFSGFEGEDFRNFKLTLENYFELSNIMDNKRKLVILKTQLYHAARTFVNKLMNGNSGLSYDEVMKKLMEQYITPELIQTYEYAFNNMTQGMDEHPRTFYTRLFEAAELAEIESDSMIQSRFRAGVHPIIRQHCVSLGCRDIDSWLKSAEGYWSAHHPQQVNMIGNPFHPQTIHHHADPSGINVFQPPTNPSLNSITTTASSNSLDMNDILKSLRDIVKDEHNNQYRHQPGYNNQAPYPRTHNPRGNFGPQNHNRHRGPQRPYQQGFGDNRQHQHQYHQQQQQTASPSAQNNQQSKN